jgi:hypothetical protein
MRPNLYGMISVSGCAVTVTAMISVSGLLALAESLPEIKVLQRFDSELVLRSWLDHTFAIGRIAHEHELVSFLRY